MNDKLNDRIAQLRLKRQQIRQDFMVAFAKQDFKTCDRLDAEDQQCYNELVEMLYERGDIR